jgi:hypothetical protein
MEQEIKARIDLLEMLINRECSCDKSKCAEHFLYMESLLYEYKCKYEEVRAGNGNQNAV